MTTTAAVKRKRPEEKAVGVLAHETGPDAPKKVAKQFTGMKTATKSDDFGSGIAHPNDEQLAKINEFTKSTKTAEELVVFRTLSCNDILDRDLDKFKTSCVKKFAELPEPYSSVGKSYMVSHDTTKLPVGRLFDVGTQRVGDNLFLWNDVYMPNTEQYKDFLENQDFGIYWAVSVGVMLGASTCTIGKEHDYNGRWWCSQGHEKGLYYDPNSDEVDSWGWPEPVDESDKNAVLCTRDFDDPTDFYELSQVYLGAQYFAELKRDPELAGVIKSANKSFGGFINLGASDAEKLPMQHANQDVVRAKLNYPVLEKEDGSARWTDERGFMYIFEPANGDVLCLGKEQVNNGTAKEAELREKHGQLTVRTNELRAEAAAKATDEPVEDEDEDPVGLAQSIDAVLDEVREALDAEDYAQASDLLTSAEANIDDLVELLGGEDADDSTPSAEAAPVVTSTNKEGIKMSKKAVQAAAREAKLPDVVLDKLAEADDDSALQVLVQASAEQFEVMQTTIAAQEPMVAAGTTYLDDLRDEVKRVYILSKQDGGTEGVSTDTIDKLVKHAGNDIELLKALYDDYKKEAQVKFPSAVRRSSFPVDPLTPSAAANATQETEETPQVDRTSVALRIHR